MFEQSATAALRGAGQAVIDAHAALSAARAWEQPHHTAIYCTVDFDPVTAQLPAVVDYVRAFSAAVRDAGYLSGVYGGTTTLHATAYLVDMTWQAAGWSQGIAYPADLRQLLAQVTVGGVQCDQDQALTPVFGAWTRAGPWPVPTPTPQPPPYPVEGSVTVHDVVVSLAKGRREALHLTAIPFAKALAATILGGAGPIVVSQVSLADEKGDAVVVIKLASPATDAVDVTVRVLEAS